jgi:hypothetical protein
LEKSNYSFQKRQKELARKKNNEEKKQRKLDKNAIESTESEDNPVESEDDAEQS